MRLRKSASKFAGDCFKLGTNAPAVITLRMLKLARGGAAAKRERKRMTDEKVKAALDAQAGAARSIMTGKALLIPARTLALYQKRVGQNLRRLLKKG